MPELAPRLLLVLAHPDDESFGAGGTIALVARHGGRVSLICATKGGAGARPRPGMSTAELEALREAELRCAAEQLGIQEIYFLGAADNQLASDPARLSEQVRAVAEYVAPSTILTFGPDGITGHPDHIAIGRAAEQVFYALCEAPGGPRRLYFLALPPDELPPPDGGERPPANVEVEISATLAAKIAALRCHASQPDALAYAERLHAQPQTLELFHRAYPPLHGRLRLRDLLA